MFKRRRLPFVLAAACLLFASGATAADPGEFTAGSTPSYVKPSTSTGYTVTLTNDAASEKEADRAKIGIPADFVVDAGTVSATTSAAGTCVASSWVADGTLISDGKINVKRPEGNPNEQQDRLCPGATLTVVFAATSAATEGAYAWTTELLRDVTPFTLTGAQPTIEVDGTAPVVSIDQKPATLTNSRSATFSFTVDAAGECKLDGGAFAPCASPVGYLNLEDGAHTFVVRATDGAGNTGQDSYTWTVDATPPAVAITDTPSDPTNSRAATFAFTSDEAAQCKLESLSFAACSSPVGYSDLGDGSHTFTVQATDAAGNTAQATYTWTVDTVPPAVAITAKPSDLANSRSASFGFTADEATECSLDGGAFAVCASPTNYVGLADGSHTFTVRAHDAAGNTGQDAFTWVIDATPPTVAITDKPTELTNSRSASFSFTASEATQCKIDDGAFTPCTSPASYADLPDGAHAFTVKATDAAQNSVQETDTWTIDATPPTVAITGDKPGNPTNSKSAGFTFTISEDSTTQCELDGGGFAACTSPKNYVTLADGQHTFIVRATDEAGNSGESSYTWAVDSEAPTVTITSHPETATKSRSASFSFTAGEPTECKLDAAGYSPCTGQTSYSNLSDGLHTFTVKATDAAGNVGQDVYGWTIDNVAPSVNITQRPTDPSDVKSPTLAFSVNEGSAECKLDAAAFSPCTSPKSYASLSDGQHTFTVKATDAAGNTGQAAYSWRLETTLPVATLLDKPQNPSASTTARFEFASRPQATFECSFDGGQYGACASPKVYSGLSQGLHSFAVRAKDGSGTGPATSYAWALDSIGPTASIVQTPGNPTSSRSATFAFTANEAASFACQLDGGGFGPCGSPISYQGLGDGLHTFTVRPTDLLGNVGAPASYGWSVDGIAPVTTFVSTPAARTTALSATFAFSANEPASFQCRLDAATFAPCSSPKTVSGLRRAAHVFEVRAVDAAGNVDATPAVHRWTVVAPTTTRRTRAASALLGPRAGARVTSPPLLRWRGVARASYYNVQLYRGSVKLLSAWPRVTRLQLRARWTYLGRQRRLTTGTYRWYVWPGYGKPSQRRYGRLLGGRTFKVVSRAHR